MKIVSCQTDMVNAQSFVALIGTPTAEGKTPQVNIVMPLVDGRVPANVAEVRQAAAALLKAALAALE